MKATEAQLTIVIPIYNRADIVRRTLNSVAKQTLRPLKVILVDNNSTDNSLEVISAWRQEVETSNFQVTIISEMKPGACAARNAGLRLVETPWTMFFDSDDEMLPDHAMRAMSATDGVDIVAWDVLLHRLNGATRRLRFIVNDCVYNNIMHSSFSTQRYMAKTNLFRQIGGWNERLSVYDDCELGTRLLRTNPRIIHLGSLTVHVHESEESITLGSSNRLKKLNVGLDAIRENLPSECRHWVDLQQLIKISTWASDYPEAEEVVNEILSRQPFMRRQLWRVLYKYSLHGGRGVARIYRALTYIGF